MTMGDAADWDAAQEAGCRGEGAWRVDVAWMDAIVRCVWNVIRLVLWEVWGVVWTRVFLRDTASDTEYKRNRGRERRFREQNRKGTARGGRTGVCPLGGKGEIKGDNGVRD